MSQHDKSPSDETQEPEWLTRRRSVVVLFIEATILLPPQMWAGWCEGPVRVSGFDGRAGLPTPVWSAVVGTGSRLRRWHIDLEQQAPVGDPAPAIIAVEAMRLSGASDSAYLLAVHIRMKTVTDHDDEGLSDVDSKIQEIPTIVGAPVELHQDWGTGRHLARSAVVAQLVCVPDDPSFLPMASFEFPNSPFMPGHLEMFCLVNEEPIVSAELVEAASNRVLQIPGGEVMVGINRSVVAADFGEEAYARTCVVDAFYFVLAQRVSLRRLTEQGEFLADPGRNPRGAANLSRAIVGYLSVYSWAHTSPPSPITQILVRYRELTSAEALEGQLQGFSAAAQTAVNDETNLLLALLTILGFAVAVAAAVSTGAKWQGWQVLWGVGVALLTFGLFLLLPFGRPIRQALIPHRRPRLPLITGRRKRLRMISHPVS